MKTLYDLIGAFPDDDAEALRDAFRNAVKSTHPDVNSGNPDAPLKFRQIVRANAILSDPAERAAYDRMLAAAEHPTRAFVADTLRKLAADAIAVIVLSAILVAGYAFYTLYWPNANAAAGPAFATRVATTREPVEITVATSASAADASEGVAFDDRLQGLKLLGDAMKPNPDTSAMPSAGAEVVASAEPSLELPAKDAKSYRERGVAAYHDGDLARALANFDLAIQLDPGLQEAYVDRSIVFYRMQQFDRAFADIAEAKRIERAARSLPRKPPPSGRN
jgi:tetratricopeptide (TPR) repeat protein